jgi:putative ribosome biogenesis GTPase RsgA
MRYPIYFLNKDGNKIAILSKEISFDKTPRYIINPKCPYNTYTLYDCLKDWQPVYKYYVGDKVEWIGRFTNRKFDCIVKNVNRKDNLIRIVADKNSENPLIYSHYYVEPEELRLKQ